MHGTLISLIFKYVPIDFEVGGWGRRGQRAEKGQHIT